MKDRGAKAGQTLALAADASPVEIAAIRARLARLAARAARSEGTARPFLVVTPLGLERRDALEEALATAGVEVTARAPIHPFPPAATALYVRASDDEALHRALAFERLWHARWKGRAAERWTLASKASFARLVAVKHAVRSAFPSWSARITTPERAWTANLHAFHAPDPDQLDGDARLLDAFATEEPSAE